MGITLIGEQVKRLRNECTGQAPVHFYRKACGVVLGLALGMTPFSAAAAATSAYAAAAPTKKVTIIRPATQSADDFYRMRKGAPLWFTPKAGDAADQLVALLSSSSLDGLSPERYQVSALQQAIATARQGKPKDVERADRMLSNAFVSYLRDLKRDPGLGILYVDPSLKPAAPSALAALIGASNAPSLSAYVRDMGWMSPIYAELRKALADHRYTSDRERQLLTLNLERAKTLGGGRGRYIIVNAAQQRLYTYENGKQVDSMVVVVGKPKYPTPMMTAYVRFASLNPYWFVPPDLAAERIAPKVLKQGLKYLDDLGYQIMSSWKPDAQIIEPNTIDWKAVAEGKTEVFMRQLPGPHNSMGRMKFMFPNEAGIYLHDNPERELFREAARLYSGGCVRLEDAPRLGRWLFGRDLDWQGAGTEQMVPLQTPVPVYITYLTAMPSEDGSSIAFTDDVYGRDAGQLATLQSSAGAVASARPLTLSDAASSGSK